MKKTVVVELLGGLGNQMFQYAVGRALELSKEVDFYYCLDQFSSYQLRTFQLDVFQIKGRPLTDDVRNRFQHLLVHQNQGRLRRIQSKLLAKLSPSYPRMYTESKNFIFDPNILSLKGDTYLKGYWQSPLYFESVANEIRGEFQLKERPSGRNEELIAVAKNSKVFALHVRRGDYVTNAAAASFHGSCTLEYYQSAINLVEQSINPDYCFVFSDDIEWCRQHISANTKMVFVDHNDISKGYEDMRIMSYCSAHIIANSTFSWWGAWLAGDASKLVIAPKQWTAKQGQDVLDIYPKNWVLL